MPGLAKSMVASFYYDQKKDLCQITFKGTPPSSNKNVFWDVESCKKECKTDKHNYEEVFTNNVFTNKPATEKEGLIFNNYLNCTVLYTKLIFFKRVETMKIRKK